MRELKFRVWDKKYSEWIESSYNNNKYIPIDGWCKVVNIAHDDVSYEKWWIDDEYESSRIEIMQYTWLKDKNGKEIYEGDIVQCSQKWQIMLWKVVFKDGMFWWEFEKSWFSYLYGVIDKFKWEVIGNIHENPELINS